MRTMTVVFLLLAARALTAGELTLNQQLILACYKLEVGDVVRCLRKGADANARFGESVHAVASFSDGWTGGFPIATASWTPIIALAASDEFPGPPAGLAEIWKDPARSAAIRKRITREQIQRRRNDAMVILNILLSHRCNLEDHDGYGATALYLAVENEKVSVASALIDFGANPNVKVRAYIDGPSDISPLHEACRSQELVQLLLDHGADAEAKDSEGRTAADWIALKDDRTFDVVKTSSGWRTEKRVRTIYAEKSSDPFARPGRLRTSWIFSRSSRRRQRWVQQ